MSFKDFVKQKIQDAFETPFSDPGFTSNNAGDAIVEAKQNAEGFPRAGIPLIQNGLSSNNDLVSYSNLTPDTDIVFPVTTKLNELTIANTKTGVQFDLELYKNGTSAGNLIKTLNISTGASRNQLFDLNADNLTFTAGDFMKIIYIDQGSNASDLVVMLWISRIP